VITIVIPAAGEGSRFRQAGYTEPKPLIPVCGVPMIHRVLENVTPKEHDFDTIVVARQDLGFGKRMCLLEHPTAGALQTILAAHVRDGGLLIANCDQLCDFDPDDFVEAGSAFDGAVVTFPSSHPHHSYVEADAAGIITRIVEKEVISGQAVTGVYFFREARDFLDAARDIVQRGIRTNGEFYVSLAIDAMIHQGKQLLAWPADTAILGTPDELQLFEMAVRVAKTL
jgi:NDP-sugar pyrophosphorylase family protein